MKVSKGEVISVMRIERAYVEMLNRCNIKERMSQKVQKV
jgi:hypothetical protein